MKTLEERIIAIEDRLGITADNEHVMYRKSMINIHLNYGFTKSESKRLAHVHMRDFRTVEGVEAEIVARGAIKCTPL